MNKITILWLGIATFIACWLILLFHGAAFHECYDPHLNLFDWHLPYLNLHLTPSINCLLYAWFIVYGIIFFGSLASMLLLNGIYIIIFNRPLSAAHYILWFSWLALVYFCFFLLTFFPEIF